MRKNAEATTLKKSPLTTVFLPHPSLLKSEPVPVVSKVPAKPPLGTLKPFPTPDARFTAPIRARVLPVMKPTIAHPVWAVAPVAVTESVSPASAPNPGPDSAQKDYRSLPAPDQYEQYPTESEHECYVKVG